MISSRQNQEVKFLRSLTRKKYREVERAFVIEGVRIIEDALQDQATFIQLYYSPMLKGNLRGWKLLEKLLNLGVKGIELTDSLFTEVAGTETPQGILAVLRQPQYQLKDLLKTQNLYPHLIMINGVQDPGNLGTILRTAAGAGWAGAVLTPGTVDLYNPKSIRATMGALHKLPILKTEDTKVLIRQLKEANYQFVAAALKGEKWHFQIDFQQPTVMIMGNEGHGVEAELLAEADQLVKIPMAPEAESLNVAIAAGVLIFEGVRQNLMA